MQRQNRHPDLGAYVARLQRIRTGTMKPRCARVSLHGPTWSLVEHQTDLDVAHMRHNMMFYG
jgi:hypothetical protein